MSEHPLKMSERLKNKKRPVKHCRIFVGDQDDLDVITNSAYVELMKIVREKESDKINESEQATQTISLVTRLVIDQSAHFQKFSFRAMKPVEFEQMSELPEYAPREKTKDIAYNVDTFPRAVFFECMIEPERNSLTPEEWEEFFENCSQKEYDLLLNTSMEANLRNIEPTTPKGWMTPN
jgi:hypothetical protein